MLENESFGFMESYKYLSFMKYRLESESFSVPQHYELLEMSNIFNLYRLAMPTQNSRSKM